MKINKTIYKIVVTIISIFFLWGLFIYRQHNLDKLKNSQDIMASTWWQQNETVCTDDYSPVCWDDWKTYSNRCYAENIKDINVAHDWECINGEQWKTSEESNQIWENNLWSDEKSTWNTETWTIDSAASTEVQEIIKPDASYYKNLRSQCENEGSQSCCIASVDTMETSWYKEAENWVCPNWYSKDLLKCASSYSWCEKITQDTTNSSWSAARPVNTENTMSYYNESFTYWFSMPKNVYYSWYQVANWSNHTVWISSGSWATDLDSNDVKVYFYKNKILPELEWFAYWQYKDSKTWKIYINLNWNSVVIESDSNSENIANMILKTIYVK